MSSRAYGSLLLLCLIGICATAQTPISVADIWQDYKFTTKSVPGFNFLQDGKHYVRLEDKQINSYDITTGKKAETLFDLSQVQSDVMKVSGYSLSDDESQMLIRSRTESIYRRSAKSIYHVYQRGATEMTPLFPDEKVMYASFSPDGTKVAFVYDNNVYYRELSSGIITQVTHDGKMNHIINGSADWVYEEEFSMSKAFAWSPDSEKIAYYRFDESEVPEFTMTNYRDELYPEYVTFKYPKVGEKNSKVTIHIHSLTSGQTAEADPDTELTEYIPRIQWSSDPDLLCITTMNRHQNHLRLRLVDAGSGKAKEILEEKNEYYIDIHDNLTFLPSGKQFVWTSEQSGYNHIYLHTIGKDKVRQLTMGDWDVTEVYGVDEKNKKIYFQAADKSPLERHIYEISMKGGSMKALTPGTGTFSAQWSSTYDYWIKTHSSANRAPSYEVVQRDGKSVRGLEDNAEMTGIMETMNARPVEFFRVPGADGVELHAWRITPPDFDETQEYPVLMYVYGGPGSQTVKDSYMGMNYWWYQMLAQQGYVVVSVDNRGTGARGQEWKKMTYLQLGKYETQDQIAAAKHLATLPYVDGERVGIWGWSYGGYMSSLCLLKGADIFKMAMAVAPVTNWKWYDTIYTERYMRTPAENPDGYADNSPVYFADQLEGKYLLIHGMGDDNVHFQNAVEMSNALIKANKQYDTYYYPNRNHGIYGGNTRLHLFNKLTDFVKENL